MTVIERIVEERIQETIERMIKEKAENDKQYPAKKVKK